MARIKIEPKFTVAEARQLIVNKMHLLEDAMIQRMIRTGELFITDARSIGSYRDQTGNLRSSTGYCVLKNGQQMAISGFEKVKGTAAVGSVTGQEVLNQAIAKFPTGLVLIGVAGMHYAAAVESRGKDVITGSSRIAVNRLKKSFAALQKKVK